MKNPGIKTWFKDKPILQFTLLIACVFTLSFSHDSLAVDCVPDSIFLTTQAQADSFVSDYGTCDNIVGTLHIKTGPFNNLNGLENITSIGGDLIITQVNIAQLSGLHNLKTITGDLDISSIIALNSLSYLSSLTTVGSVDLEDIDGINSLTGLENLSGDIQQISIMGCDGLNHLVGLPASLNSVADFRIESNDSLQTLTGLPVIAELGGLKIWNNPLLASIRPPSASTFSSSDSLENTTTSSTINGPGPSCPPFCGPYIEIIDNPQLTSLEGFPTLPPTITSLEISFSPLLTSLDPLAGVLEIRENFSISFNDTLSDCSALLRIMDDVDDGFPGPNEFDPEYPPDLNPNLFGMMLNAEGCNTIEEVLNSDSNEGIFLDGFEDP